MKPESLAVKVREKALELGFIACGIIKVDAVEDYADRLKERIELFPESRPIIEPLIRFAQPQKAYPWAKSIIVCAYRYGKYQVPAGTKGLIGKYYLYEYKTWPPSGEYANFMHFDNYLSELGMQAVRDNRGVAPARWAAYKAGLGRIRRNNFLYTNYGSWVALETWVTDQEMECLETAELPPPCPKKCSRCADACPTGALAQPYAMNASKCVTFLTTIAKDLIPEPLRNKTGTWLYGCDICQDVCPNNINKWAEEEEYPQLREIAQHIDLEKIFAMDEQTFLKYINARFPLINKDSAWRWKYNAINAMANSGDEKYRQYVKEACNDANENVRNIAAWAWQKLK